MMQKIFYALMFDATALTDTCNTVKKHIDRDLSIDWSPIANLHLTLYYVGPVKSQLVQSYKMFIKKVSQLSTPDLIQINGIGELSRSGRRYIVALCDKTNALLTTHNTIKKFCQPITAQLPSETFIPHITLGEVKHNSTKKAVLADYNQTVQVRQIALCESIIVDGHKNYQIL